MLIITQDRKTVINSALIESVSMETEDLYRGGGSPVKTSFLRAMGQGSARVYRLGQYCDEDYARAVLMYLGQAMSEGDVYEMPIDGEGGGDDRA